MASTATPCFPKGTGSRTPSGNRNLGLLQPLSAPSISAGYEPVGPTNVFAIRGWSNAPVWNPWMWKTGCTQTERDKVTQSLRLQAVAAASSLHSWGNRHPQIDTQANHDFGIS